MADSKAIKSVVAVVGAKAMTPIERGFPAGDLHMEAFEVLESMGIIVWQHSSEEIRCMEEQVIATDYRRISDTL